MASADLIPGEKPEPATILGADLLRIWLVDDHAGFRRPMAHLLSLEPGVECPRLFSSAAAVLLALQEEAPDVILLDVEMPKMNGVEAIKPIRKLAPATKVLMLTTFSDDAAREQALLNGAADFLLKNCPPRKIVAAIRAAKQPPIAGAAPVSNCRP